jgi:hypothetical protein
MITLQATTETLEAVLSAAPATTQPSFIVSYTDLPSPQASGNQGAFTGTTAVTMVTSPAANICRAVRSISIYNGDTAAVTVEVFKATSSGNVPYHKITLQPGYNATYAADRWVITDANGNFLETVEATIVGTPAVEVGNWPTLQNINLTELDGSALAGPTAWGTAPASGAQVLNVNANIVSGGGGGGSVNVTEWDSVSLGSPTAYGTAPSGDVIGVNAYVTSLPALPAGSNAIGSVSVSNFPSLQAVNWTELGGTTLAGPSAYGSAPTGQVQGVNAYITNSVAVTQSGSWSVSITGTAAVTQSGSWTVAATQSGTWSVAQSGTWSVSATQSGTWTVQQGSAPWSFNWTALAGTTLGAPSNYGTSPGAVAVQGVNAYVTNTVPVSGTFWQTTQPVSIASLPALATGGNTIGAVTQASGPWTFNLTQIDGTSLGAPTAWGTTPSGNVIGTNSNIAAVGGTSFTLGQNVSASSISVALASDNIPSFISTGTYAPAFNGATTRSFGSTSTKYLNSVKVFIYNATITTQISCTIADGAGNTVLAFGLPPISTASTIPNYFEVSGLAIPFPNNTSASPTFTCTASTTTGTIGFIIAFH